MTDEIETIDTGVVQSPLFPQPVDPEPSEPGPAGELAVSMGSATRDAPDPSDIVDGVYRYPLSQPQPAATTHPQEGGFNTEGKPRP